MSGGAGYILDSETSERIADADVKLECRKSKFHGSEHVRDVDIKSSETGRYEYDQIDVWGCTHAYVHASKQNYIETGVTITFQKDYT